MKVCIKNLLTPPAYEKALLFYDTRELPVGWPREGLLGSDSEMGNDSDSDDQYVSRTNTASRVSICLFECLYEDSY